ncbi:MAG: hypothetical protein GEV00_14705 [Actinophytocola sp.]|nr:hypothetical protein [Actinophytocola sp.]
MTGAVGSAEAARPVVPPILYIPVADSDVAESMAVDFRRLDDGRIALFAYTALDRLVRGCGRHQPWVLLPTAELDEIAKYQPYDVIYLDVQIAEDQQRSG